MAANTRISSLSLFFPAYNEALNLPKLVEQADAIAKKIAKEYELIVVNDGSTDDTKRVMRALTKKFPNARMVSHKHNKGYGAALKTGIAAARHDWVFFTDADMQFDLSEITTFLPHTTKHSVIIGWRKNRAEGAQRAVNARIFKHYIDLLYRIHVKDIDCAFKLFQRNIVQAIHLESSGAFTTAELLYKLKKQGVRFKELPVSHYPRVLGTPTGANLRVILTACWESLKLYLQIKTHAVQDHIARITSQR